MSFSPPIHVLFLTVIVTSQVNATATPELIADVTLTDTHDNDNNESLMTKMLTISTIEEPNNFTFHLRPLRTMTSEEQVATLQSFEQVSPWIFEDGIESLYVTTDNNDDVIKALMRVSGDDVMVEDGIFVRNGSEFWLRRLRGGSEGSFGRYLMKEKEEHVSQCGSIGKPVTNGKDFHQKSNRRRIGRRYTEEVKRHHQTLQEQDEMLGRQHYIEIAAYVDEKTADHYGEKLNDYITQTIAGANLLYHRPLLQVKIILSLLKVQVVRDDELKLRFGNNTDSDFAKFCHWQSRQNPLLDTDPRHHDLALLFTQQTIELVKGQTLEGVAPVGEICKLGGACAVIKSSDNLAKMIFTTAHEIGHLLNMVHDDAPSCGENHHPTSHHSLMLSVMTTFFTQVQSQRPWSDCNVRFLQNFLGNGNGKCLYDVPQDPMLYSHDRFPGEVFNGTEQCQLMFGNQSRDCPKYKQQYDYCAAVMCEVPNRLLCESLRYHRPDGTQCESHRQCFEGKCIKKNIRPRQIGGSWSSWSSYGKCSRACDGGVKKSTRRCDDPSPQFGGQTCMGASERYRTCNRRTCERKWGRIDYRLEQCNRLFRAKIYSMFTAGAQLYQPQYFNLEPHQRCQLFCRKRNMLTSYLFRYQVDDGTRCTSDSMDVCISGSCQLTGCDGVIGSGRKLNKCGVCALSVAMCGQKQGREFYTPKNMVDTNIVKRWNMNVGTTNIRITKTGATASIILRDTSGNVMKNMSEITTNYKMVYSGATIHFDVDPSADGYQAVRIPWALQRVLLVEISFNSNSTTDGQVVVDYSYHFENNKRKYSEHDKSLKSADDVTDAPATATGLHPPSTNKGLVGIGSSYNRLPTTSKKTLSMSKHQAATTPDSTKCGYMCDVISVDCDEGSIPRTRRWQKKRRQKIRRRRRHQCRRCRMENRKIKKK